jgi:hypothetical protein
LNQNRALIFVWKMPATIPHLTLVAKLNPITAASKISDQAPHAAKHRLLFESGQRALSIQVTLLCEIFGVTIRGILRTLACRRKGGQFEIKGPI